MTSGRGIGKGSSSLQTDPNSDSGKGIRFGQDFAHCILSRQFGFTLNGPLNTDVGVAPQEAALVLRVPVVRRLIEELGRFAGDHKAMRKPRRYPQLTLVVCGQFNAHPLAKVGR